MEYSIAEITEMRKRAAKVNRINEHANDMYEALNKLDAVSSIVIASQTERRMTESDYTPENNLALTVREIVRRILSEIEGMEGEK